MKHPLLGELSPQQFLTQYWQKKPVLLSQTVALETFWNLDANDIAGLALEDEVESRLITHQKQKWTLTQGPFTEETLTNLSSSNWTLLVQAVDLWCAEARTLLNLADFLPAWRRDDLMVSIAAPGGGVGPHTDAYDVFLVQISGEREWRIAPPEPEAELFEVCPDLWQVPDYEATEIHICRPGDVLYLPPGWRHNGIAKSLCMTASIGFRAPSLTDLLVQLIGQIDDNLARFSDPSRTCQSGCEITPSDITRLQTVLAKLKELDARTLAEALASVTTQPRLEPPEVGEITLFEGNYVAHPATRFAWYHANSKEIDVFVNGQKYIAPHAAHTWLDIWSTGKSVHIVPKMLDSHLKKFMSTLLSIGCVYPVDNH